MRIQYWLNGKMESDEILPGQMLYELLRKRDVIASNAVVKRQHADYVRYGWRKNRYCPVPCWPPALTESML